MPRTRNVTRSQWDAANVSHTTTRNRNENENVDEGEKENAGRPGTRTTRSHTRPGRNSILGTPTTAVLGATTAGKVLGERIVKAKTTSKGKGKPSTAPLKRKKLPLQDITDQFLPAPEAANRGEGRQGASDDNIPEPQDNVNHVVATIPLSEVPNAIPLPPPKFTSPLPPSSPPSESTESPVLEPQQPIPKLLDAFTFTSNASIPQEHYASWEEFDNVHPVSDDGPANVSPGSDPFGFVSLERKLKVERETVAAINTHDDQDSDEILVADTSSPRPVRRLKRSQLEDHNVVGFALDHTHYATPPTPHKDKQKRRRISHEDHDIFSPCASSIESSPSPSKLSARKRHRPDMPEDPLDEFYEELDRSYEAEVATKKAKSSKPDEQDAKDEKGSGSHEVVSRSLRPREKRRSPEKKKDQIEVKVKRSKPAVKGKGSKKPASKSKSAAAKKMEKAEVSDNEEDLDEKRDREHQERLEYFKRLEDYHVEKEDVYFI